MDRPLQKSYNAAKTVGEEGKSEDDLIRKNGDIPFKGKTRSFGTGRAKRGRKILANLSSNSGKIKPPLSKFELDSWHE